MRTNQPLEIVLKKAAVCLFLLGLLLIDVGRARAQQSTIPKNIYTPLVNATGSGRALTVGSANGGATVIWGFLGSNPVGNAINNSTTDFARLSIIASLGSLTSAWLEVRDPNASNSSSYYPAGSYAGFVIGNFGVADLRNKVTVATYMGSSLVESKTMDGSALAISLLSGGKSKVGFVTTAPFNRVRITFDVIGLISSRDVYYAEVLVPRAGPTPACNSSTTLTQDTDPSTRLSSSFPAVVTTGTAGVADVSLLGNIFSNIGNVVDADNSNSATITLPVLGVLSSAYVSVRQAGTVASNKGYFAGFEISNSTALSLNLLNNTTISTYLNGALKESFSGSSLLLGVPLLSSSGKSTIGFVTKEDFDEIRYTVSQPASVNLGTTNVYNAVVKRFCESPDLVCNTLTELNDNGTDPVYINMSNTGVSGAIAVNNNITDLDKLIDGNSNTAAVINAPASVSVLSTPHVSVKKALLPYVAGTYVAFDVETESLLYANVLATAKVTLYLDGQEKQFSTGSALLVGTKSTLLSGSGSKTRQYVGIVANTSFDEVKLEFNQPVGATLGNVSIYGIKVQKNCSRTLTCNSTNIITNAPAGFGAVINSERSGVSGAICANCNINNINSVVTSNPTTPAKIFVTAGVIASAAISVQVPANTFPKGTVAGFLIRTNNTTLVGLDLLKYLKIETFYNGAPAESGTGGQLLGLDLATLPIIGPRTGMYNVGFKTTMPYNEIRISTTSLVGANVVGDRDIDVFYATVDTRYLSPAEATGIGCSMIKTNPDINYTTINKPVNGNVKTNDVVPDGTTYDAPVASVGASGQATSGSGTFSNWDNEAGTYTFTATAQGVYSYSVNVCKGLNNCKLENLTITVTDPTKTDNSNPPILNTDIALTKIGVPVAVRVLLNDHAGNKSGTLGNPEVDKQGFYGTAAFAAPDKIVYTPGAGFVGRDTVVYKVKETPSNKTGFAYIIVETVPEDASPASAADDFTMTDAGAKVVTGTVNVKDNDTDPPSLQTVSGYTKEDTQGKFVLDNDGNFEYTPAAGYTGTAQYTYETTNNAGAKAKATVYVAVAPATDLVPGIQLNPNNIIDASTVEVTVQVNEIGKVESNGIITLYVDKLGLFSDFSFDPVATKNGADEDLQNNQFNVDVSNPDFYVITTKPGVVLKNEGRRMMFKVKVTPGTTKGSGTVNVYLGQGSGGDSNKSNNSAFSGIIFSFSTTN